MDWASSDHMPSSRREPPAPTRVSTLFRVVGASERPIRCATYQTAIGLELRLEYEDNEYAILRTELFKPHQEETIAERATEWRGIFDRVGGFRELAILGGA